MTEIPPPTPQLDRQSEFIYEADTIRRFIDWLEERGIWLCEYDSNDDLYRTFRSTKQLLYDYYEIDPKKLAEEQDAILEYRRALNQRDS